METPSIILLIIIMLSSFPVGYLLAYLTRDELVQGRKWFKLIFLISIIVIIFLLIFKLEYKLETILSLSYLIVISLICLKLSWNKKFVNSFKK